MSNPSIEAMSQVTERSVVLPGRGTTFIREALGPARSPTLVLLHGLSATSGVNWSTAFDSLSRSFRFVAIDHRGHGRGISIREHFRLADCADDVAALADALDLDRFVPVGYSMGGPIAQLIWHRHPDRVAGLVLCATACNFASPERRQLAFAYSGLLNIAGWFAPRRVLRRIARDWLAAAMADPELRSRVMAELAAGDPVAVSQAGAALARFSSADWISGIDVPTAVVVTEQDRLVPAENQLQMARMIRAATVHRVPGDHSVCLTRPELFVPALLEACTSVADRAASSVTQDTPRR